MYITSIPQPVGEPVFVPELRPPLSSPLARPPHDAIPDTPSPYTPPHNAMQKYISGGLGGLLLVLREMGGRHYSVNTQILFLSHHIHKHVHIFAVFTHESTHVVERDVVLQA
ncbi:hypothetical protein MAR_037066 [Mya arenaria]|uniref:Uncharacterized protein n=1 Tax=Mya arenaria TaxID=6604 RepID=A0ABY7FQT2_MYAAR|nr:hypothetical protein MAR_037066 [Mya arenaria]